jgi:hypothetical protein
MDGSGFTGATAVLFGAIPSPSVSINGDDLATATVPQAATTAPVTVVNLLHGNAISSSPFTVVPVQTPTLDTVVPTSGDPGDPVTVTGTNFCGATSVLFNGVMAPYTVDSNGQLSTVVPSGATSGPISLSLPGGQLVTGAFTVNPGGLPVVTPTVSSYSPSQGAVGTSVTINGSGFTGATDVSFNGVSATDVSGLLDGQLTATVPPGAMTGPVSVSNIAGTGTSATNFTVSRARTITLAFPRGRATGHLRDMDGTGPCAGGMTVRIQNRSHNRWRTILRPKTRANGTYRTAVRHWARGSYRAVAPAGVKPASGDLCGNTRSATRHRS